MVEQAGDKGICLSGQALHALRIMEDVASVFEERHIDMHTGTGNSKNRLWHKGRMQTAAMGHGLDRQLEGHDVIRGTQGIGILKIDLVLAGSHFMVAGLDLKAHVLQSQADLPAGDLSGIHGAQIKIAGLIVGLGSGFAVLIGTEQEELRLGAHIESVVAHIGGTLQYPLEHAAGIAHKGAAVRVMHIADEPRHLAVLAVPGKDDKGIQIGIQVLVGLINADKALDGGAVKHDLIVDRLFDLRGGNGHIFQLAENIGKLQANELHIFFPDNTNNIFFGVAHIRRSFPCYWRFGKNMSAGFHQRSVDSVVSQIHSIYTLVCHAPLFCQ